MLLSVVIPHYNIAKELLKRCIDSITSQGMPDDSYEVIIVDDGSDIMPEWIGDEYPARSIRLIKNAHGGPGAARNRGIEEARGQYIQFVDADDYLLPNGQMLQCLATLEREKPQILRFSYAVSTNGKEPRTHKQGNVKFNGTISGAAYMRDNNLSGSPCTYFFLKELATDKQVRFSTNIFHEDEEFNTKLHYHALTLIESNATLYCYCIREGSTTANNSKDFEQRRINDLLTIVERIAAFKKENAANAGKVQSEGITHKLDMLAVDAILNMMYDGRKAREIYGTCKSQLSPQGLFPLRKASYSFKYIIFRALANTPSGMRILRAIIPGHKPHKQ